MAPWMTPPTGGEACWNTLRTNSSSAASPLVSTISHPYARQFLRVFWEASSLIPLREHTMIFRAPCFAMWMARFPQRPLRPPTMRYEASGRRASLRTAGRMGTCTSSSPLEMITLPMCRPLRMYARADGMSSKPKVVMGWIGLTWPPLTRSKIWSSSLLIGQSSA